MCKVYVTKSENDYRTADSRVSLRSLVYVFREGLSPESMAESFPTLTLEEVYGAIAFYLAHQADVDDTIRQNEAAANSRYRQSQVGNAELIAKLRRARIADQVSS